MTAFKEDLKYVDFPVIALFHRARDIVFYEGWPVFFKQVGSSIREFFYAHGVYFVYEVDLQKAAEAIMPPVKIDCTVKLISNLDELEELVQQNYKLGTYSFKPKLARGTLAFCVFVQKELAHVTCISSGPDSKKEIDNLDFAVDFNHGEVCSGASYTHPKYRGKGLLNHVYSYIYPYLLQHHYKKNKFTIEANNTASQKSSARYSPKIIGRGRYLKFLWWRNWKPLPLKEEKV
jgi:hypothetical protein